MVIQLYEKQEEMRARREYVQNMRRIRDLDDVCCRMDDIKYRICNIDYEFKNRHIREMSFVQDEMIDRMRDCEERNLEIEEVWGKRYGL